MYRIAPLPEAFPNERLSLGFAPRIGLLALLFVLELIAISIWLDTSTIAAQGGLTGFVSQWGSRILQATVAFASLLVTFGYLQAKSTIQRLSDQLTRTPMTLGWFAGHTGAMVIFGFLSHLLFQNSSGLSSDWLAGAWLTAGVCGIVLAGLAFVPPDAWFRLFRETGTVFIAAAVAESVFRCSRSWAVCIGNLRRRRRSPWSTRDCVSSHQKWSQTRRLGPLGLHASR